MKKPHGFWLMNLVMLPKLSPSSISIILTSLVHFPIFDFFFSNFIPYSVSNRKQEKIFSKKRLQIFLFYFLFFPPCPLLHFLLLVFSISALFYLSIKCHTKFDIAYCKCFQESAVHCLYRDTPIRIILVQQMSIMCNVICACRV
jgi:hypothetical protein